MEDHEKREEALDEVLAELVGELENCDEAVGETRGALDMVLDLERDSEAVSGTDAEDDNDTSVVGESDGVRACAANFVIELDPETVGEAPFAEDV